MGSEMCIRDSFLDRSGGSDSLGYDYQEVAGIDAKNGLVMFNLQSKNAL